MSEQLTVTQKRAMKRAEFKRKFGQYWFIYVALLGTAVLSAVSGLLLPFQPDEQKEITITVGGIFAAIFYSIGFLTTGEAASYFWFDKLTDHDPDSNGQKITATLMLTVAIGTSLVTALAAGSFIAFWLGVFDNFFVMPPWAQKWVVFSIPTMWVLHFIAGTAFRAMSEESEYERESKSIIRTAQNEMIKAKETARANWWKSNAPALARQMGEAEAQEELDGYKSKIQEINSRRPKQEQNTSSTMPRNDTQTPQNAMVKQETTYTLKEYLDKSGMSLSAAQTKFGGKRYSDFAEDFKMHFGDATRQNMQDAFYELIPNPTQAAADNHR